MPNTLSTTAQTSVRRVLDGAARRLLAERLGEIPSHNDNDPAGNRIVGTTEDAGAVPVSG